MKQNSHLENTHRQSKVPETERGATTMEYALLAMLIMVVAVASFRYFTHAASRTLNADGVGGAIHSTW